MAVSLAWQGPVGPGAFPGPLDDDRTAFETLCEAGVYLRIKVYDGGRIVAYVGQSVSLLPRFDQHLTSMLSLATPLRDCSGDVVFSGDAAARFDAYGRLDELTSLAAADVGRVRFFFALCDAYFHTEHLNLAEGLLQRRMLERLSDVENAVAAPGRLPEGCPDVWTSDFSGLDAAGAELLESLLGRAPMRLDGVTDDAA